MKKGFLENIIEFINFIFFLILIFFSVLFFIVGNRVGMVYEIAKSFVPLSYVVFIFWIKFRFQWRRIQELNRKAEIERDIILVDAWELTRNYTIMLAASLSVLLPPFINDSIDKADILQVIFVFVFGEFTYIYLFKKRDEEGMRMLGNMEKMIHELLIFFLPVVVFFVGFFAIQRVDIIDLFQVFIIFGFMYIWHFILFKKIL